MAELKVEEGEIPSAALGCFLAGIVPPLGLGAFILADSTAPSSCAAEVEAMRAVWAGRLDGYAKAATPVTSAQV
jgi:hypothetical protein